VAASRQSKPIASGGVWNARLNLGTFQAHLDTSPCEWAAGTGWVRRTEQERGENNKSRNSYIPSPERRSEVESMNTGCHRGGPNVSHGPAKLCTDSVLSS
jgi:hypothetical protein